MFLAPLAAASQPPLQLCQLSHGIVGDEEKKEEEEKEEGEEEETVEGEEMVKLILYTNL